LPLWRTFEGVWQVDASRARTAGLVCRPIVETVADTWEWLQTRGVAAPNERSQEVGLDPAKEQDLLATVGH
jgi:hypothetical protein